MIAKFIFSALIYVGGIFCGEFLFGDFLSTLNIVFLSIFLLAFSFFDILNFYTLFYIRNNIKIENRETQERLNIGMNNVKNGLLLYNLFFIIGLILSIFIPSFGWGFGFLTFVYMFIMISVNKKLIKLYSDLSRLLTEKT